MSDRSRRASEDRLDDLRQEAARTGRVEGSGVPVEGGPIPPGAAPPGSGGEDGGPGESATPGYYGQSVVKPPVWTWEIPAYFFVGGLAGMAALLSAGTLLAGGALVAGPEGHTARALLRASLWTAVIGAVASTALLISDLGRSGRFLNMLRVFKWRSPMSVGAWTLAVFGGLAFSAALLAEWHHRAAPAGPFGPGWTAALVTAVIGSAILGVLLSTYTGVLIGATSVPAWFTHRGMLPVHFGNAGLGSAVAFLILLGFRLESLYVLGFVTATVETVLAGVMEVRRHGPADRALRRGRSGLLIRTSLALMGPLALGLWIGGVVSLAAASFLAGALLNRFGWMEAGRVSGRDPEATFSAQR